MQMSEFWIWILNHELTTSFAIRISAHSLFDSQTSRNRVFAAKLNDLASSSLLILNLRTTSSLYLVWDTTEAMLVVECIAESMGTGPYIFSIRYPDNLEMIFWRRRSCRFLDGKASTEHTSRSDEQIRMI